MQFSTQKVSKRLIYSGASTIILPFAYGVGLLCIQSFDPKYVESTYKVSPSLFFPMGFFIQFVASFISNSLLYSFPKGSLFSLLTFVSSAVASVAVKKYYAVSSDALFYCDSMIALSIASVVFTSMLFFAARYATLFESRVPLTIASFCFALGYGFFNLKEQAVYILLSRVYMGFAAGVISKYLPCYLSLIAPIEKRGIFSSLYSLGLVGGLLAFNAFLSFFKSFFMKGSWIVPIFFLFYPALIHMCMPLSIKSSSDSTLFSLIINPSALKSLLFVSAFHLSSNLCGINQLALSPQSIYGEDYGFHSAATLFIGLIVSFFSGYLLELFGRKNLTLISSSILVLGCIAFYFKIYVTLTAYVFSFGFNLGLSSVPYVIMGEIFPEDYISPGAFFGTSCNWIGSALSTVIPQGDVSTPYNFSFIIYLLSTVCFSLCILIFFKETKGRTPCFQ